MPPPLALACSPHTSAYHNQNQLQMLVGHRAGSAVGPAIVAPLGADPGCALPPCSHAPHHCSHGGIRERGCRAGTGKLRDF